MLAYRPDPRPGKLDLGIGVYRDETGNTPIIAAVKAAGRVLVETQRTETYLGVDGDADIRLGRVSRMRGYRQWRRHLDEMDVRLNGEVVPVAGSPP